MLHQLNIQSALITVLMITFAAS